MKKNRIADNGNKYVYGPLKNLSIHDAFIIVAIYAAQFDRGHSKDTIKCISASTQKNSILGKTNEGSEDIIAIINLFTNHMFGTEPMKVVEIAAKALSQPLREEAFEFAKEITEMCGVSPEKKLTALSMLATKLELDKDRIDGLAVCTKAPEFAEHHRFSDDDEPCDDGRSG
jgi:hypothetical protein